MTFTSDDVGRRVKYAMRDDNVLREGVIYAVVDGVNSLDIRADTDSTARRYIPFDMIRSIE